MTCPHCGAPLHRREYDDHVEDCAWIETWRGYGDAEQPAVPAPGEGPEPRPGDPSAWKWPWR